MCNLWGEFGGIYNASQEILIAKKFIGATGTFLPLLRGAEGQLSKDD